MAVTKQEVAELYVATFNRAPDATGLDYWVNDSFNGNPDIDLIAMSFFDQPETQALYPADNTDEEFVNAIYRNLFNRDADPDGLAYWIGEDGLGGGMHRSVMIQAVKNGATGTDADIIANKAEVALYVADILRLEITDFSLASVTEDDATVTAARAVADDMVSLEEVSIDTGTLESAVVFDAGSGAFNFTDDASVSNNVVIHNFSSDDTISISNAAGSDYTFANDGVDVQISLNYNDDGIMNIIQLVGVAGSEDLIFDHTSFVAAIGFDPFAG